MHASPPSTGGDWLRFGAFQVSATRRELWRGDRPIGIGQRSLDLLLALLARPGEPVSKERLMQAAWGDRAIEASNLTVQIAALRRLLAGSGDAATDLNQLIRTVPGYGYVLQTRFGDEDDGRKTGQSAEPAAPNKRTEAKQPLEPLTQFIGRDSECRALVALLEKHRLVCLAGIGGVGKTRLALRLGRELAPAYADGAIFVDLAPLLDPGQVAEAVAAAVGAGHGWTSAQAALAAALSPRHLLLILDNAEHLTTGVRQLLKAILAQCPRVVALVTSRESLGLPGEVVFRLSPLEPPPEFADLSPAEVLRYDAVQLFTDRAQALLPDFTLDIGNTTHVVEICRRLDGIALAIEMAVPRLEVLTLQQLAERLQDRFRTVAPLRHDVLGRQRTLQSMFDWSWELLSSQEQRLLQVLAIFASGATLVSLEAVAAAGDPAEPMAVTNVIGTLTTLAQKSLIVVSRTRPNGEVQPRYQLLETTRQYVLDHLDPVLRQGLTRRQACHFADLFEQAERDWPITHGSTWLHRYGPEMNNLRAAMQWAFERPGESELALRLVAASFSLWWELPELPLREGRHWYGLATARITPSTPPAVQARLWLGQSWADTLDGDLDNYPAAERAVRLFRTAVDPVGLGAALWRAASTVVGRDHDPSDEALLDAAVQALEAQPATKWRALCQVRRADLLQHRGVLLPALAEYDRALTVMRDIGYNYGLMVCGGNLSYLLFRLGRHDAAIATLRDLRLVLPVGLSFPLVSILATVLTAAGHEPEARSAVRESLLGSIDLGMLATLGRTIEAQALLSAQVGDSETAARLMGFVMTVHAPSRLRFGPRLVVYQRLDSFLAAALSSEDRLRLMAEGAAWTDVEAAGAALRAVDGVTAVV